MTRTMNARIAGFTFLGYIAAGIGSMVVFEAATSGGGIAEKLARIGQHPTAMGVVVVLELLQCFAALILAVTLYAITREEDPDLAMLGLTCRVSESVVSGASVARTPALMWLALASGVNAPDTGAAQALAAYLLRDELVIPATFFAVGSTIFSYLLLRGRMIPVALAWLGVLASVVVVVLLPLQAAGFLHGLITKIMWLPMLAFEAPLGVWLIVKGVRGPAREQPHLEAVAGL